MTDGGFSGEVNDISFYIIDLLFFLFIVEKPNKGKILRELQ